MFDASQLPAYSACFRLPIKRSTGRSSGGPGDLVGLRSSNHPARYAPEGARCLFSSSGWRGCMDLRSLVECYSFLLEGLSVADI